MTQWTEPDALVSAHLHPPSRVNPYPGLAAAQYAYGSFLRRFVALLVDGILVGIAVFALGFALETLAGDGDRPVEIVALILGAGQVAYFLWGTMQGGTPGYRALGLRVTTRDGSYPSLGRAAIREWYQVLTFVITGIASILIISDTASTAPDGFLLVDGTSFGVLMIAGIIWLLGCYMVLLDPHKQAMHDKFADTFVIRPGELRTT